jgi:hypothetical protein
MDMDLGWEEDREREGCLKKKMRMRAGRADDSTSTLRALEYFNCDGAGSVSGRWVEQGLQDGSAA